MCLRISLCPTTLDDVDFVTDIKANPDLWPFEDNFITDKVKVKNNVIDRMKGDWYKQYIIQLNNDKKAPIGEVHIHEYVWERKNWEIGWCIFPEYQRKGYGYEAARAILRVAFEDLGAHRVVAMCNSYNEASYRIMEKLGMSREGVFRQELPWNGKWVDQFFYAIIDTEYKG